jgi:hypothetical protein
MNGTLRRRLLASGIAWTLVIALPIIARADEVLDWNAILMRAARTAGSPPPPVNIRLMAIVHAAMFDALNGIERRYTPVHVDEPAPLGASRRAAVVQAAYTTLVAIYPAQAGAFAQDLEASLAAIA